MYLAHLHSSSAHCSDVVLILCLQDLDHVHWHGYISSILHMHASLRRMSVSNILSGNGMRMTDLRPLFIHSEVELILVTIRCLLAQPTDSILLRVEVSRTENIIFVLLEEAELRAMRELRAFLVISPV